jgi:lipocalin
VKVHHGVQIRATHRHGFRSGEWANLVGIAVVERPGEEARACYFVAFSDGATDYWVMNDPDATWAIRPFPSA